jgi:putative ABC transport system permease protein
MEKLFGIPMTTLAWAMSGLFALVVGGVLLLALRQRVLFKMGVRNIPRRRQETVLIILGLMLATLITSAAFSTGDTITHTIRSQAARSLGEIDLVVRIGGQGAGGPFGVPGGGADQDRLEYFPADLAQTVQQGLAGNPDVEAVVPAIVERAPVVAPVARLSAPQAVVIGAPPEGMLALKAPLPLDGDTAIPLADLAPSEVYVSQDAADELDAAPGDTVHLFLGPTPTEMTVRAVVQDGGAGAGSAAVYLPLDRLQALLGYEGRINRIWISNTGDPLEGAERSEAVQAAVDPLVEGANVEVIPEKQERLDEAEQVGSAFVSIFVLFGLFSIAAGVLLIFLIFVMLAAERKPEMGMARAVGMQRRHLVQTFLMEGTIYDLAAAAVGAALGIAVSFALVRVMAAAFGQEANLDVAFNVQPRSVIVAYTAGMVLTFIVVTVSAWRVSVLNIVRAIRDLPEPRLQRTSKRALIGSVLMVVLGLLSTVLGIQTEVLFVFSLGVSLVIIGGALLARRFGLPDRAAFTFAGVALLVFWLLPEDAWSAFLPEFNQGLEMFFLSGIMIVAGAVWTVMYNADLLIAVLIRLLGSSRRMAPILKMAVSYPLHNRFRTGMTLAMFALVVFTIIFMAVIVDINSVLLRDRERLTGGMDIIAATSFTNPVQDLGEAIAAKPELDAGAYQDIGSVSALPMKARQPDGQVTDFRDYVLRGADDSYLSGLELDFALKAEGYETAEEVWEAVRTTPGLAVVDAFAVPSRNTFNVIIGGSQFRLEGVFLEDETMQPIQVEVQEPFTGRTSTLTVIGVIDELSFFTNGMYVSQGTLGGVTPIPIPATAHFIQVQEGVDAEQAAKALESAFLENGMEAESLNAVIDEQQEGNTTIQLLLQGFMGLGLLVGIAALGVISARAVVERRRQIGALRAIGFQKGMVQATFLLESSFIAILGITIGVALGLALSYVVTGYIVEELGVGGATFQVPWGMVLAIVVISYAASLLTTAYPAWQASRVYPAEALRYE